MSTLQRIMALRFVWVSRKHATSICRVFGRSVAISRYHFLVEIDALLFMIALNNSLNHIYTLNNDCIASSLRPCRSHQISPARTPCNASVSQPLTNP